MENTLNPTTKQRVATAKMAGGMSASKAMREAGYSANSAKNPRNLTSSEGFKRLCKYNGLTESLVVKALVEDINDKPRNRTRELSLAMDILGMKKDPPKDLNVKMNQNIERAITDEDFRSLTNEELMMIINEEHSVQDFI